MRTGIAKRLLNLVPQGAVERFSRGAESGIEARLHAAAELVAGWHDFGDTSYREGLERLLAAIELSNYSAQQREGIRAGVVSVLTGRLYSERGWLERPECLGNAVQAPLIICGLPRSGTTALHKIMSMDHRFQGLNGWLVAYPMPRPPRDRWPSIPEYRLAAAGLQALMIASPTQKAAHFRTADEVDECLGLMSQSFVTNMFPAAYQLPTYDDWFRAQDQRPTYRRLADNLRLIGSNDPEKPWLLKNPGHILALDALLDVFPDARVVWTHRHPSTALASLFSLLAAVRSSTLGANVTTDDIPGRELSLWSQAVKNALVARDRHPENFHDIDFREFAADPAGIVRAIYGRFGIDLDPTAESAMQAWIRDNPQGKHGDHSYDREPVGVSNALIEERFGDYIERFGLALK